MNIKKCIYIRKIKKFEIEIFAGFTTSGDSDIYSYHKMSSTNKKLIEEVLKKSTFKSNVNVSSEDKIITLSTCSYNFEDARYVLLGILKEIE